jgi:hypothetical protein
MPPKPFNVDNLGPHLSQHDTLHRTQLVNGEIKNPDAIEYAFNHVSVSFL